MVNISRGELMPAPLHVGITWQADGQPASAASLGRLIEALDVHPDRPTVSILAEASDLDQLRKQTGGVGPSIRWISMGRRSWLRLAAAGHAIRQLFLLVRLLLVHGANQLVEIVLLGREKSAPTRSFYKLRVAVVGLLLLPLAPLAWAASIANQVVFGFLMPVLAFPFLLLGRLLQSSGQTHALESRAVSLGCDIWVRLCGEPMAPVLVVSNWFDPAAASKNVSLGNALDLRNTPGAVAGLAEA
jgi:hypothetical protein